MDSVIVSILHKDIQCGRSIAGALLGTHGRPSKNNGAGFVSMPVGVWVLAGKSYLEGAVVGSRDGVRGDV